MLLVCMNGSIRQLDSVITSVIDPSDTRGCVYKNHKCGDYHGYNENNEPVYMAVCIFYVQRTRAHAVGVNRQNKRAAIAVHWTCGNNRELIMKLSSCSHQKIHLENCIFALLNAEN